MKAYSHYGTENNKRWYLAITSYKTTILSLYHAIGSFFLTILTTHNYVCFGIKKSSLSHNADYSAKNCNFISHNFVFLPQNYAIKSC